MNVAILAEGAPTTPSSGNSPTKNIVALVVGVTMLTIAAAVIALGIFLIYKRRNRNAERNNNFNGEMDNHIYTTMSDMQRASSHDYITILR